MITHDVYLDESGDLGWNLDVPYRNGGSSRYFTIAYIICERSKSIELDRLVRRFYKRYSIPREKEYKGMNFNDDFACIAIKMVLKMLKENTDMTIGTVTVKKANCPSTVNYESSNILYNYMVSLALVTKIQFLDKAHIIPDKRSIPRESINSCPDLIKTKAWFEYESSVLLEYSPEESYKNKRLIFIDWIANFVWRKYEDERTQAYKMLKPFLEENIIF